ncbi:hypothetical protein F2Q69_00003369 [Brassica cretica]|uniref:Uncharacterized protein n=1 Tax=Brassica cretica TaxID=69181 RepID=A0A8S9PB51_BRACR|nr:hypothetical protein F2Q69_00003369 [Brassica cretica]
MHQESDFWAIPVAAVTHIPASHRRLIRRRILALLSAPSPSKEMRKRKPKNSLPSKAPKSSSSPPSTKSPPPINSPPHQFVSPPNSDEDALPSPVSDAVSDAHLGSPAVVDAQQTRDLVDLSSNQDDCPTEKTVIVDLSTDPSSEKEEAVNNQLESSSAAPPASTSEILQVVSVTGEAIILTETTEEQANADAKDASLSLQPAKLGEPSRLVNGEKEVLNTTEAVPDVPEMPTVPTKQPQTEKPASAPSQLQPRLHSTDMVIAKSTVMVSPHHSKLGNKSDMAAGESSGTAAQGRKQFQRSTSAGGRRIQ